ncbi:MAG: NADH:ubiquinone reductase (Na(+)-transporting) subunit C [Candidatus Omnitrophica bacterium]|nr:NADH:ubiquinone reductase (Na(+)-transporting) subunit C [Candidatus Omnitrophota bacterium]
MARGKAYVLQFTVLMCLATSTAVSVTAVALRPFQTLNAEFDRKRTVLNALGLAEAVRSAPDRPAVLELFDRRIRNILISPSGDVMKDTAADADASKGLPAYLLMKDTRPDAIAIPVYGRGLWSRLDGYLALESDLNTIRNLIFYKHGETPGLGGEIEKRWFSDNFKGKKIFDDRDRLVSVEVVRGQVKDVIHDSEAKLHAVDGISGATLTGRGVTHLLADILKKYEPFLDKHRSKGLNSL